MYRSEQSFYAIYVVRAGCFKTSMLAPDGYEQVTGFQIAGELLGLDGIAADHHTCQATALEDSRVYVVPFAELEQCSRASSEFLHRFHKIMSGTMVSDQAAMMHMGRMRAEARLASFILDLIRRLHLRGFSAFAVNLRMTRAEIGSYLGLTLETVSRLFSKFNKDGILEVRKREVRILDVGALCHVADGS